MIHLLMPLYFMAGSVFFSSDTERPTAPVQPSDGPGGQNYVHAQVTFSDHARRPDGFWLFEPAAPAPENAPVVVFHHGYGAINPMIYGAWIRHIVRQGNIVIYPRYQKNLIFPTSKHFVPNAARGIQSALKLLSEESGRVRPDTNAFFIAGHSYGGAISANIASRYAQLGLPHPKGVLLCAPGTGPLKGGLLESYQNISPQTRLGIIVSVNDYVVGEELGRKVYQSATQTPHRFLMRQFPDAHGAPELTAGHNECYAMDPAFDGGVENLTLRRARRVAQENAADYFAYWKMLDAIMSCALQGAHCELAKGCGPKAAFMGQWSDGHPVQPMEVWVPEDTVAHRTD
jgi:acetyl esterase/lipase